MLWLKACPRCGGDLQQEGDICGLYAYCLQCARDFTCREKRTPSSYPLQSMQSGPDERKCQRPGRSVAQVS